ncbi:hypothetical protein HOC35_05725 [Candidatus Woesearchaeota archaeon]|jgi:hypothetical protein|nr:hypothetical protein [Candidatus Woesearchaeota archaeon]
MVKFKKRGQAKSRTVETILIVMALAAILILSPKLYGWVQGESKDQICKFTVGSKLFTKIGSFSFIREKCPAYNIIIYDNKIVKDNNPLVFKTTFTDKNGREKTKIFSDFNDLDDLKTVNMDEVFEEKLYYTIAEEMLDCWTKFGEGAEIFDEDIMKDLVVDKKLCARCSRFIFHDSIVESGKGPFYGLYEYMDTHKHKGSHLTYNEELQMTAINTRENVHILTTAAKGPIDQKETYYFPEKLVFDTNVNIVPSVKNTYEIIYFMWDTVHAGFIKSKTGIHNMDVPSHVFFVSPNNINTYFCQNFVN